MQALEKENKQKLFFIDGCAGTGKTFLYNSLISYAKYMKGLKTAIMATTGTAATLLEDGITMHKFFKIPIPLFENSHVEIERKSFETSRILTTKLFIIDEASAISKTALDYIDKKIRKITKVEEAFGGKVIVLGGDFRQTLPILEHGEK